ncbi:aromatic-L-amino-acid decarboxylase [Halopolyspora algeriensis]|uniref:Aromatic-L-amino-acid decarboxylase n=1 Tax=Halopolyspora algeriensis TaxID=1500506 RepID=A0A368VNN8_9ACTN|nr:aromatic-L-amino-acid decarboxylase [Halopolyspora algeriensis]TQM53355.1 aromatic-L-amino-acid decarboxylase [Halopolyspora algeriensis]
MHGDGDRFEQLLQQAGERVRTFLKELENAPAMTTADPENLRELFGTPPGEQPRPAQELLDLAFEAAGTGVETAGPRFFGYIPGGGVPTSAVGELIARTVNRYTDMADLAPGLVALEDGLVRWLASVFGLPAGAGGLLTTGGSQAMLSMVLAARERHLGEELGHGRIYLSDQAHHSVRKAARIAGFPARSIRPIPTVDGRRIDPAAAAEAIVEDRAQGLRPFLLVGTAGTTNAGVVDPLGELADLAAMHGLWFHVDGCYGGFFRLTTRGHHRLRGIERADSVSLDPHKSLFLPYGTGALLVRDQAALHAAHGEDDPGDYMQDLATGTLPDYAAMSTELTREHRGLRLWLPLHLHGLDTFRAALDEKLDLAAHAHEVLAAEPALYVPEPPELSTVVFRLRAGDDAANRAFLERINASQRAFLSSTRLDGTFTLRLCILSHRTHREHVDEALEIIRSALP